MNNELLTIPEAAKILKIGESTMRRYLRRKLISRVVLPGNDHRIREVDLEAFVAKRLIPGDKTEGEQ